MPVCMVDIYIEKRKEGRGEDLMDMRREKSDDVYVCMYVYLPTRHASSGYLVNTASKSSILCVWYVCGKRERGTYIINHALLMTPPPPFTHQLWTFRVSVPANEIMMISRSLS